MSVQHVLLPPGRDGAYRPAGRGHRRLTGLGVAVAAALILTGCGGSSTPNASSTSSTDSATVTDPTGSTGTSATTPTTAPAKPPPPAPRTAQCRELSYANTLVFTNDTLPVSCAKTHTAYTYAVPTLPSAIAFKGVQIQSQSIQSAAADECRTAFAGFIGGTPSSQALTRLGFTYFLPDQQGFDLGAHWVRCDVVAHQSAKTLGDLPRRVAGLLDTQTAQATYDVCSNGQPGATTSTLVMCTQTHTWRAQAAVRLGDTASAYPGTGTTLSNGKQHCKDLVAKLLGVTGGFSYSWTYPSDNDWLAGQRFGYCWSETNH